MGVRIEVMGRGDGNSGKEQGRGEGQSHSASLSVHWLYRCVHFVTVHHYVHFSRHLLSWNKKVITYY